MTLQDIGLRVANDLLEIILCPGGIFFKKKGHDYSCPVIFWKFLSSEVFISLIALHFGHVCFDFLFLVFFADQQHIGGIHHNKIFQSL